MARDFSRLDERIIPIYYLRQMTHETLYSIIIFLQYYFLVETAGGDIYLIISKWSITKEWSSLV